MISIRSAQPLDVVQIHQLIVELAVYERQPKAVINTPELLSRDLFEDNRCYCWVAELNGRIVGFALFFYGYSTWKGKTLYLEDIYVQSDYRRHRIGQQLFDQVVEIAKMEGVKRMDWQVLSWNEPALKFYEKNKAVLDDEWVNGRLYF